MSLPLRIGGLFEGYGGLTMAVRSVLDGELTWYAETDPCAQAVLARHHPHLRNVGDVTAADWSTVADVDVLTGGFPCQDVSHAGFRAGLGPGTRSGLWAHMARAIDHLRPSTVVIENVRGLHSASSASDVEPCTWCVGDRRDEPALRALGAVLGDLADLGYDAAWQCLPASAVGAPHARHRTFVVATPTASPSDGTGSHSGPPGARNAASHTVGLRQPRAGKARVRGPGPPHGDSTPADPARNRRPQGRPKPAGQFGRQDAAEHSHVAWAQFAPAIARWERILGRPAPEATVAGVRSAHVLSPRFVEWMMGLADGHVTSVNGLTRQEQLRLLGAGVVPQQAAAALRVLLRAQGRPEPATVAEHHHPEGPPCHSTLKPSSSPG